jgi:aminomuconate-semialdehyde/2-hydroxymuconate-6-semialdehyde dehydrogenase
MEKIFNYINGELKEPFSKQYLDNINPATEEVFSLVADSGKEDFDQALKAANDAFSGWKSLSSAQRADYLLLISDKIKEQLEHLAVAESMDTGKPLSVARAVDIPRAAENFKFFAHAITQFGSESFNTNESINYTLRQPLGTVACISPWNLPLYLFTWKVAPALASGNCVIAKPSELTPYTAFLLSKICIEVGLPKGVLNILHGTGQGIGEPIVNSPLVKAISFTGGTSTGKRIATLSAPLLRKVSLELGGKNPAIVLADCDLEKTVDKLTKASFTNQGEICLCASRLLIQDEIYDVFKKLFIKKVKALTVGDPLSEGVDMGALISASHLQKVNGYIKRAIAEGGKLLCGNEELNTPAQGYYLRPHVLEGLGNDCEINQEEVFGPVVCLQKFTTVKEAIKLANDSDYGLAATLWTESVSKAHTIAAELDVGIVWVNTWMNRDLRTPFGGVKNSGLGREGGFEVLKFFTEPKNICLSYV